MMYHRFKQLACTVLLGFCTIVAGKAQTNATDTRTAAILQRLNQIVIPQITVREVPVEQVIETLEAESARVSPDGVGVRFFVRIETNIPSVNLKRPAGVSHEVLTEIDKVETKLRERCARQSANTDSRSVTVSLRSVPLIDALKYVSALASMTFRVTPDGVLVSRFAPRLTLRVYKATGARILGDTTNSITVVGTTHVGSEVLLSRDYESWPVTIIAPSESLMIVIRDESDGAPQDEVFKNAGLRELTQSE